MNSKDSDVLDVILGVDAIFPPLTGIGRYALELARRLPSNPAIERVRFAGLLGREITDVEANLAKAEETVGGSTSIRTHLANNPLAVRAFNFVAPLLQRYKFRAERNSLFHSPNYFLPPFPGKCIATVHDLSFIWYPQFHPKARIDYLNRAMPVSLRRADHLITDAESVRQEIIKHYDWPAEKVTAIPLGVSASFRVHTTEELSDTLADHGLLQGRYTLCVGTIEPRKNIDRLLQAYESLPAPLRRQYPLVLAGSRGWESTRTHERIERAGRDGWLRFCDFVPEHSLPKLYAGARLFVYPSIYEGFGLPVLEAMASGTPVLTSNISSLPEVIGEAGGQFNPQDVDDMAIRIQSALEDNSWLVSAAQAGLIRAKEKFSWNVCAQKTVDLYKTVSRS